MPYKPLQGKVGHQSRHPLPVRVPPQAEDLTNDKESKKHKYGNVNALYHPCVYATGTCMSLHTRSVLGRNSVARDVSKHFTE